MDILILSYDFRFSKKNLILSKKAGQWGIWLI